MKHEKPFRTKLNPGLARRAPSVLARLVLGASVCVPIGMACGGETNGLDEATGSETHFLLHCSEECGSGLECLHDVCTTSCATADVCASLSTAATCVAEPGGTEPAVCDVPCEVSSDCAVLSSDHRCEAGFCRAPSVDGPLGSLSAGFSRLELRRIGDSPPGAASLCDPQLFLASVVVDASARQLNWEYCEAVGRTDTYVPSQGVMPLTDANIDSLVKVLRGLRVSTQPTCIRGAGILTLDLATPDGAQSWYSDANHAGCPVQGLEGMGFVGDLTDVWDEVSRIRNP